MRKKTKGEKYVDKMIKLTEEFNKKIVLDSITVWVSKGEITTAKKNDGKPSKRDFSDDYGEMWFTKDSIPNQRGMIKATLIINPS